MTLALKLLLRVIRRRLDAGETLNQILPDYPKVTESEKAEIKAILAA